MDRIVLKDTIDILSKIIYLSEEQKQDVVNKYSNMKDIDVIKELSQYAYKLLRDNDDLYEYALEIIRSMNPQVCPPVSEMKERLRKAFSNEIDGNMSLEDNHKIVNDSLVRVTTLLNQQGIDYYIVGALPCFLKTQQPLFRYHDDIDIMVNEDDIPKLKGIMDAMGYIFYDDRYPSLERFNEIQKNKPPHTVLGQNPENEFHLGFFTFKRNTDNSITIREYSHRLEGDRVAVDVFERRYDTIGTSLRYDDVPTEYMGTRFRTGTVESVYIIKEYTKRPKDVTDIQKLKEFVDERKLEELKYHPSHNELINDVKQDAQVL